MMVLLLRRRVIVFESFDQANEAAWNSIAELPAVGHPSAQVVRCFRAGRYAGWRPAAGQARRELWRANFPEADFWPE